MLHSLGIDGTLKSTTLEGRLREVVSRIEEIEKDNGPDGMNRRLADLIKSASNTAESQLFTAECQCYLWLADHNTLGYPDPYVSANYIKGSGSEAANFNHALAEAAFAIYRAEGSSINNPNQIERKLTPPTIEILEQTLNTPAKHNAILSFSFSIPITTQTLPDGTTLIIPREYLVTPSNS